MKKIIGFMCLALIATPGCIPGNLEDFPPPIHPDEPDTSTPDSTDPDEDPFFGSCTNMAANPPGPDTCWEYVGEAFEGEILGVVIAEEDCTGTGEGTFSATDQCDEENALGYCALTRGEGLEFDQYYYPDTWNETDAETDCQNSTNNGTWTSLNGTGDTWIAKCEGSTSGPDTCIQYLGRGFDSVSALVHCDGIGGTLYVTQECSIMELEGICTVDGGTDDEYQKHYYASSYDDAEASDDCTTTLGGTWADTLAVRASCSDTQQLPADVCWDYLGSFWSEPQQPPFEASLNSEFECSFLGGTHSVLEVCPQTDIGTCQLEAGTDREANVYFYSTNNWTETTADAECTNQGGTWTPEP